MNKKIELKVLDISDTQAQAGAYVILLGEKKGNRKLPLIVGASEAQSTAICLKGIKTQRPLTHDLFHTCLTVLNTELLRVLIYKVHEGVFYSYIYLKHQDEITRVDSRTSDAIALALRFEAPIFIYDSILENEQLTAENLEEEEEEEEVDGLQIPLNELEKALKIAIEEENYEIAANLRDEINKRKL